MQGLDPDRVREILGRARFAVTALGDTADSLDSTLWLARDARAHAEPGELILHQSSYSAAEAAVVRVRAAQQSALSLIQRVHDEVLTQEAASAADNECSSAVVPVSAGLSRRDALPRVPEWVDQAMTGADMLGAGLLVAGATRLSGRYLQFGRHQWVNHPSAPHSQFRPGLVQTSLSFYRDSPVSWRYQPVPPPAWATTVRFPSWVTSGGKALGPVGGVVTGVSSAWNAGADEWNRSGDAGRAVTRGGITGTGVGLGALAGAKGGALIGAAIGSIFPGPGTVIGGALGGLIGGLVGASTGERLGSEVAAGFDDAIWGD